MSQASRPVASTLSFPTFFLDCYDAIHVQARRPTKARLTDRPWLWFRRLESTVGL